MVNIMIRLGILQFLYMKFSTFVGPLADQKAVIQQNGQSMELNKLFFSSTTKCCYETIY